MTLEERLINLKKKIDQLTTKRDRAAGVEETVQKELETKYQLKTVEEAEIASRKAEEEADALEEEILKLLDQTEEEFSELLSMAKY